jgi:hypothetical protein
MKWAQNMLATTYSVLCCLDEINNTGPTSDGYLEPMKFMVATAIIREQESERTYSVSKFHLVNFVMIKVH